MIHLLLFFKFRARQIPLFLSLIPSIMLMTNNHYRSGTHRQNQSPFYLTLFLLVAYQIFITVDQDDL
jgi:hypothetical protein